MFGPHVYLDLYDCPQEILSDLDLVFNFLDTLPDKIGMTKIMPPYVFRYSGLVPEDKGITGFCTIAESHISTHTFSEKFTVFIDVFSCKPFDTDRTIELIKETFKPGRLEFGVMERGRYFERS